MSALNRIANKAKSKDAFPNMDASQIDQINLCFEHYSKDTDIVNHPEWSPTYMNFVWNKEKVNGAGFVYIVADWISENGANNGDAKYKVDMDSITLSYLFQAVENGIDINSIEVPKSDNNVVDWDMLKFNISKAALLSYPETERLISGRVTITKTDSFNDCIIMGEGLPKAKEIVKQAKSIFANNYVKHQEFDDPFTGMANRGYNLMLPVLTLDEMNIRGNQVIDAANFVDGSIERLVQIIMGREEFELKSSLVKYVNKCAAERYDKTKIPQYLAVSNGASFDKEGVFTPRNSDEYSCRYMIGALNYENYLNSDVSAALVDYSSLDIISDVNYDTCLKIMEAHGFQLVKEFERPDVFNEQRKYLLFFNSEIGIFAYGESACDDNVCYGGFSMTVYSDMSSRSGLRHTGSSGSLDCWKKKTGEVLLYGEYTYHDGIFKEWDNVCSLCRRIKPEEQSNINMGFYGIPVPVFVKCKFVRDSDINYTLICRYNQRDMLTYHLEAYTNLILSHFLCCDIQGDASYAYAGICGDDWIEYACYSSVGSVYMGDDDTLVLGLALRLLKAPEEIMQKFWDKLVEMATNRYTEEVNHANERGWRTDGITNYVTNLEYCKEHFFKADEYEQQLFELFGLLDGRVPEVKW